MSSLLTLLGNDIEREAAADTDNTIEGVSKAERYISEGKEHTKKHMHFSVKAVCSDFMLTFSF